MVLPVYAALVQQDRRLLEAAADLGATPWQAFVQVTWPLSRPGVLAGAFLVFVPCVGEFVIPTLLGGPETHLIGRLIWDDFFANDDWPMAAATAVGLLLLMFMPLVWFTRLHTPDLLAALRRRRRLA
jgi:putrescine transport system permease protein